MTAAFDLIMFMTALLGPLFVLLTIGITELVRDVRKARRTPTTKKSGSAA